MSTWPKAVREVPHSLETAKKGSTGSGFQSCLLYKMRNGTAFSFVGSPYWLAHSAMGKRHILRSLSSCHVMQSHDKKQAHTSCQLYMIRVH